MRERLCFLLLIPSSWTGLRILKWFLSKERLMGVSRQAEFSAAKTSKVLLWVEAHMH